MPKKPRRKKNLFTPEALMRVNEAVGARRRAGTGRLQVRKHKKGYLLTGRDAVGGAYAVVYPTKTEAQEGKRRVQSGKPLFPRKRA